MALPYKFNFRGSAAGPAPGVTDGAGETAVIDASGTAGGTQGEQYPTGAGPVYGWDNNTTETRDRDATPGVHFAGIHRNGAANLATFRVDLPATGSYVIKIAVGDYLQACGTVIEILDDATSRLTITGSTTNGDRFKDSQGAETTSAAWADPGATLTFSSTTNGLGGPICYVKLGDNVAFNTGNIAYLEIAAAGGGAASRTPLVGAGTLTGVAGRMGLGISPLSTRKGT